LSISVLFIVGLFGESEGIGHRHAQHQKIQNLVIGQVAGADIVADRRPQLSEFSFDFMKPQKLFGNAKRVILQQLR